MPRIFQQLTAYTMVNIERVPAHAAGVYSFWFGRRCIYVGKTERQTLRKRLIQHFKDSSNPDLMRWIHVYGRDLKFCCASLETRAIDRAERYFIRRWQPVTNKTLK